MPNYVNFNRIAWFYDNLCSFVFGSSIKNSQIELLPFIPKNSTILIIGGGTGWIIDELTKIHSSGLNITYVDISKKMIQQSKKRNFAFNTIEFIEASIENIELQKNTFDVILTPFLLDSFSQQTTGRIFHQLDSYLKKSGHWLYIDFYLSDESKLWQKMILRLMYIFFRLTCSIEAVQLPMVNQYFSSYKLIAEKTHCQNFIISKVFEK